MTLPEKILRLVFGDQLNAAHSWFMRPDDRVAYVIMEIRQKTDYVTHHIQKLAEMNFFGHDLPLPDFSWTGETRMRCLAAAVGQSLTHAYAHHIQRLMVTGNFALLAGIHPDAVDAWYLGIYIDAIQWVELPNTRAMSQFADGGIVATKPYVSSANYINKMSDYCGACRYDPKTNASEWPNGFHSSS